MKFVENIKTKFFTLFIVVSMPVFAEPVALVNSVNGKAFAVLSGKTVSLERGDIVQLNAEVMLEEGAQLTMTDYYDHEVHLSGGSHIKLGKKEFQLKRGSLWVQSYSRENPSMIKTANSIVGFIFGEAIVSFDSKTGKTQLFSMEGTFSFSNILKLDVQTRVDSGHFSFVDPKYNEGVPRAPTKIGYQSYHAVTADFSNIEKMSGKDFQMSAAKTPNKETLVNQMVKPMLNNNPKTPGVITFISSTRPKKTAKRGIASLSSGSKNYRKTKKKSGVKVRIFGGSQSAPSRSQYKAPKSQGRNPASMPSASQSVNGPSTEFRNAFQQEYQDQKKHTGAVNSLIDELKSYKVDYHKEY
jgi:hypothetical protein